MHREGSGRRKLALLALLVPTVASCIDGDPVAPAEPGHLAPAREGAGPAGSVRVLAAEVRALAGRRGITSMPRPPRVRRELAELGRMLAFDPILSGNRNISCMTCHLPRLATGDARSLAIGEGATGLGARRVHPEGLFIPRNAPPLFNLFLNDRLFLDGRVEVDRHGSFHTPAGEALTAEMAEVLDLGAVSALPLFPVADRLEMRGQPGENELADLPDHDFPGIWAALMRRLGRIPEYRRLFEAAYPHRTFEEMSFAHAANAIAAFLVRDFSMDDTPWDRFLSGDHFVLTREQMEGARLFLNAPCATCHNGPAFSDGLFHDVALAQFGPGTGGGVSGRDDLGRMNVTGNPSDAYRFRTPQLRNVELTAPYGHAGQFAELSAFIDHYSRNAEKLLAYDDDDIPEALLRGTLLDNKQAVIAARSPFIVTAEFDGAFVRAVTAFMEALSAEGARRLDHVVPDQVPSGLPVQR